MKTRKFTLVLAACLLTVGASHAQFLEAVLPVGDTPDHVLWNPTSNKVFCSNNQSASVSIISGETNEVIATVPVADYPVFLEWNSLENKVYCTSGESNQLTVIDGTGDTVLKSLRVPGWPGPMAYNAVMNKLYVSCYDNEQVAVIDAGPDTVMKTVAVRRVGRLLWHPMTNRVFSYTDADADTLKAIDCVTDEVDAQIPVGGADPTVWCYNHVNNLVYLSARNAVYGLTPDGDSVVAVVPGWGGDIAAVPQPNKLYSVGVPGTIVIECQNHTVVDTIPNVWGELLCDTVKAKVYCADISPGVLHVIDAGADTLIKSIPLGRYPANLCWNRMNSRVYIADQMDNVVYVIRDTSSGIAEGQPAAARRGPRTSVIGDVLDWPEAGPGAVLDVSGRRVASLRPGKNDLSRLPAGVYFCLFETGDERLSRKVVLTE